MSHYDKKIEDYEDALFALLMDRLSEEEGEKYKLLNEQLKNDPQYKVPEEFSQCCYYTIKKEFSKMRRRTLEKAAVKLFQRASMLMVAFALLLTSTLALSPSLRSYTANWILEIMYDHANISFTSPNIVGEEMEVRWLPEGYSMVSKAENVWEFQDANKNWRFLTVTAYNGSEIDIDTEDASLVENVQIGNLSGLYVEKESNNTLAYVIQDESCAIMIYSNNLDKDTLIKIAQNIFLG